MATRPVMDGPGGPEARRVSGAGDGELWLGGRADAYGAGEAEDEGDGLAGTGVGNGSGPAPVGSGPLPTG